MTVGVMSRTLRAVLMIVMIQVLQNDLFMATTNTSEPNRQTLQSVHELESVGRS